MTGTLAKGELSLSQLKEMLLYLSVFKSMCGDLEARADVQRVITSAKAQLQVQSAKHSSPPAQCLSQQQLKHRVETDQEERACRSLARLAVAGSDYVLVKKPAKAAVRRDFCVLFEGYYDPVLHPYPAGAGRQFLADLLERMLGFQVSLQQLITWFPKPHNQSLEVHPELQTMLRNRGIPNWPPNADKLPQCLSYKLSQRALKKRKRSETESQSDDPDIAQTVSACVGSGQGLAPSAAQLPLSSLDPALCGSTDTLMLIHELELL